MNTERQREVSLDLADGVFLYHDLRVTWQREASSCCGSQVFLPTQLKAIAEAQEIQRKTMGLQALMGNYGAKGCGAREQMNKRILSFVSSARSAKFRVSD